MGHGALSWRRAGWLAGAVLVIHLLLLRGLHDASRLIEPPTVSPAGAPPARVALRALAAPDAPPVAEAKPVPTAPRVPVPMPPPVPAPKPPPRAAVTPAQRPLPPSTALALAPPAPAPAPAVEIAPVSAPSPASDGEPPVYPTRLPPPFTFVYAAHRGAAQGSAELQWQAQDGQYAARLVATRDGAPWLAWDSVGAIDAAGLAPLRHTDRRRGRGIQAANFQRDAGKVSFSGPPLEHALPAGAQDRLSWMVQLAAIAAADPQRVGPGGRVSFLVVGARGDADVWTFVHAGEERLLLPDGSAATLRLLREPQRPWDTRAEVWLDPARHFLPVQARLSNGAEADALQLRLSAVPRAP